MENEQSVVVEDTTPMQHSETESATETEIQPESTPKEQEGTEEQVATGGSESGNTTDLPEAPKFTVPIKFNHEKRELSVEDAAQWAQKGMHYQGMYDKICRAAALNGKNPTEYVDSLESAVDERYKQELMEKYEDEDTVNQLMELYLMKKESTITDAETARTQAAEAEKQTSAQRIASEYVQMQKDFPELSGAEYANLPTDVKAAANDGMPLAYAYLLHKHIEQNKKQAAEQQAAQASAASTGSLSTEQGDSQSEFDKGFLAGLWGR